MSDSFLSSTSASTESAKAQAILKARARALARPLTTARDDSAGLSVVEFRLAQERYAIEQRFVREVHPFRDITAIPCTPAFIIGVISLRGEILPVIDMKKFFELPQAGITDLHTVIRVHTADVDVGILADAVVGICSIARDAIQLSLPTLTGIRAKYLKGVTDQGVVIIDVTAMLADPMLVVNQEVGS